MLLGPVTVTEGFRVAQTGGGHLVHQRQAPESTRDDDNMRHVQVPAIGCCCDARKGRYLRARVVTPPCAAVLPWELEAFT